jgi:tRNA-2-methylthio-N6-dimethylallyladenosine synthase
MLNSMVELTINADAGDRPVVYLETFGCQMNVLDSELVRGHLAALGYQFTQDAQQADVVLYNTCSVRQQAENKVLSRLGLLGKSKQAGREVIIGVLGCMAEREGEAIIDRMPQISFICGPGDLDRVPMLIDNACRVEEVSRADRVALQGNTARRTQTLSAAEDSLESLDLSRAFDPAGAAAGGRSAYVRITRGCNKFCTYCVVPHTRGAEVHRPPNAIVEECRRLAEQGVLEVTLLGQTVNHYLYVHGTAVDEQGNEQAQIGPGGHAFQGRAVGNGLPVTTFADLLMRIHDEVPAIQRLRFLTSYPRDFGDDVLDVMASSSRICPYLHVPAQSGSDRILAAMNRGYDLDTYLRFIDRVLDRLPDASIAGDLIVGFPTETEADFEATCELVRRVPFKNNFVFKYSPRPGTVANRRLEDDIPEPVKRRRCNELLAIQGEVSAQVHAEYVGRTLEVFVERISPKEKKRQGQVELGWEQKQRPVQVSGRTPGDLITVFDAPDVAQAQLLVGRQVPVLITGSGPRLLLGGVEQGSIYAPTPDNSVAAQP